MKTITQLFFLLAFSAVGFAQTRTTAFIDFGDSDNTTEEGNYNNVTQYAAGGEGSVVPLVDSQGNDTGIILTVDNTFNGINENGTSAPTDVAFPASATSDSFFGSTEDFQNFSEENGGFTLTGLEAGMYYSFSIFASRVGDNVNDNRSTLYTVVGATTANATLDAANNTSDRVVIEGIQADDNGAISFTAEPAEGENDNSFGFYYLGAIEMVASDDPNLSTNEVALDNSLAIYPNPVATRAQISFELKEKTQLKIGVYDLSGRLVENIVNGEQAAGTFSTTWNRSSNLSSGLYILQIDANGKRVNSKLLLK